MRRHFELAWVVCVVLAASCSDHGGGTGDSGTGGTGTGAVGASGGAASGGTNSAGRADGGGADTGASTGGADPTGIIDGGWMLPEELQLCDGPCQCADGMDNDGDGVADGFDSECTGPGDNDEGTFATGIPGDNRDPKWQDCFFDGDSGAGNDGCRYATGCLTGDLPPDDPDCEVTRQCIDFCQPRTPNGCDCFGCCTFTQAGGKTISVLLEATCQEENLAGCTQCIPTEGGCSNECGRCELCPGKSVADLPADCGPPPPTGGSGGTGGTGTGGTGGTGTGGTGGTNPPPNYTCDDGVPVCTSTADCPSGRYCSYGCCLVIVI